MHNTPMKNTKRACPCCSDWKNETRGRIVSFTMANGTMHYAPDMWLGSRARRIEQQTGEKPLDAFMIAAGQWAEQCELQQQFEAQRGVA